MGLTADYADGTDAGRAFEIHQARPPRLDTAKLASLDFCFLIHQCPGACSGVVYCGCFCRFQWQKLILTLRRSCLEAFPDRPPARNPKPATTTCSCPPS